MEDIGFDNLLASLSALGAESLLPLPGVDEPTSAASYVRQVLALMQPRGHSFEEAWSAAINRIQAPQGEGGYIEDPRVGKLVLDERAQLEEIRPFFQANYEGRPLTTRERASCTVAAWRRLEGKDPRAAKRAA